MAADRMGRRLLSFGHCCNRSAPALAPPGLCLRQSVCVVESMRFLVKEAGPKSRLLVKFAVSGACRNWGSSRPITYDKEEN
jgi:hypothetical protein